MSGNDQVHSHGRMLHDASHAIPKAHEHGKPYWNSETQPHSYNQSHSPGGSLDSGAPTIDHTSRHQSVRESNVRQRSNSVVRRQPMSQDRELKELEEELEKEKREIEELKDKQRRLDREIREATDELNQMPKDLDRQLDETTKQLTVAERFLSSADTVSEAELVRMVEIINDEILQLSSVVADMIQVTEKHPMSDATIAHYKPLVITALGNDFLDMVIHKQLQDTMAIQIGWQGILVHCCLDLVSQWTIGAHAWSNTSLHNTYDRIHADNDQTVAARWRAITFGALRKISPPEHEQWSAKTTQFLLALPVLCGYIADNEAFRNIHNAFCQRMAPLVDKCLELSRVLFEGVLSSDIHPYVCDAGDSYNSKMVDLDYEDEDEEEDKENSQALGGQKKGKAVAFSLAIGLYRSKKVNNSIVEEIITKAKVILLTTVESMIS